MAIHKTVSQFRSSNRRDLAEVVEAMGSCASHAPGWMHIQPWVDEEDLIKPSLFDRLFSSSGPAIPNATWVPGSSSGGDGDQVGFAHGSGPDASRRLAEARVHPPVGWSMSSDHRHRGLVLVGPNGNHEEVLHFILAASANLSKVPTDDRWLCGVSRRA